jgi:MOSC domain-containing protein
MDLGSAGGFAEDAYVGRALRIGSKVVVSVLERDPRCKMITLDPDTAEPNASNSREHIALPSQTCAARR